MASADKARNQGDPSNDADPRSAAETLDSGPHPDAPTVATLADRQVARSICPKGPAVWIDGYKLVDKLGEGGFGVVYAAQQNSRSAAKSRSRLSSSGWTPRRSLHVSPPSAKRWR